MLHHTTMYVDKDLPPVDIFSLTRYTDVLKWTASIVGMLFITAPLFVFVAVCRSGRASLMGSLTMTLVAVSCTAVWTIYASPLVNFDVPFLLVNIPGFVVNVIALMMRAAFPPDRELVDDYVSSEEDELLKEKEGTRSSVSASASASVLGDGKKTT